MGSRTTTWIAKVSGPVPTIPLWRSLSTISLRLCLVLVDSVDGYFSLDIRLATLLADIILTLETQEYVRQTTTMAPGRHEYMY